jgi:hypothetical protein
VRVGVGVLVFVTVGDTVGVIVFVGVTVTVTVGVRVVVGVGVTVPVGVGRTGAIGSCPVDFLITSLEFLLTAKIGKDI